MVEDDALVDVAGRIADGAMVDWTEVTSTMRFDETREIAQELALVGQIAAAHRQLHQLLPASADAAPSPTADRSRWGHLDLLNVVGRGSYGVVYRAWDTRLERLVALKLFHGAANPDAVMQEGRMLARVRHEKFVTVYGADVIDGVAGIWMELVHGKTLDHIVKTDGPLPVHEAASVGIDIAKALAAVHAAGLLHCDVKAQNVVRESTGRVVLMDLGAGRMVPESSDGDQISDVAGTPRYMAPELFATGATATRSSDIYSFGVLLYFLVSRSYPVDGKTLGELKQAHGAGSARALGEVRRGLPRAFLDIVSRAVDPDPARRPESAAEIEAALTPVASPAPLLKQWWVAAAAAAGIVLLLATARPLFTPSDPQAPAVRSIAVLPIKNLTGDPAKAYIADGLTEILISNLARVRTIRVPSSSAVVPFRNSDASAKEVAATLSVELLLAGSLTQVDSRLRIALQLIDPTTGVAIWGEELAREPSAAVAAQAEITRMVAGRLALNLTDDESATLAGRQVALKPEAADAYLRGMALRSLAPSRQDEAASAFRQVVESEPRYAPAWAELGYAEVFAYLNEANLADRARRASLIREFADRALQLDPSLGRGYLVRGTVEFYHDWNFAAAEMTFRDGLAREPNDIQLAQRLSMLLAALGRLDEAITLGRANQAQEPWDPFRSTTLGMLHYYARDFTAAEREMRRALSIRNDFAPGHFMLGRVLAAQGRLDEALPAIEQALARVRTADWLAEYARTLTAAGRTADAQRVLDEVAALQRRGQFPYPDQEAYLLASRGELSRAITVLTAAVDARSVNALWLAVDPRADPLRSDPRFVQLLRSMRLMP